MSADTRSSTAASDVIIVLTTLPAEADAEAFAEALVTERLAACVSVIRTLECLQFSEAVLTQDGIEPSLPLFIQSQFCLYRIGILQ